MLAESGPSACGLLGGKADAHHGGRLPASTKADVVGGGEVLRVGPADRGRKVACLPLNIV